MTIKQALDVSKRSVSFLEAEIFLAEALVCSRETLHTYPERSLTEDQTQTYARFLERREKNEPVAYITGHKEFYSRLFHCDSRALIPRPETEGLIDQALNLLPERFQRHLKETNKPCPIRILELGTGCGNIAITLCLELSRANIPAELIATDISANALTLAAENWSALQDERTRGPKWLQADLFCASEIAKRGPFDLIIANLPYVPAAWRFDPIAQPDVIFYEPEISLFGGEDGLEIYRRFFNEVAIHLQPDGLILLEYNEDQTQLMRSLISEALPEARIKISQDYAGLDRTVLIER